MLDTTSEVQAGDVIADWPSTTFHVTVTELLNQPFSPAVPARLEVMTGGDWSATVTTKVAELLLPATSFTKQVTVVLPMGKFVPDTGAQLTPAALMPEDASFAVGNV